MTAMFRDVHMKTDRALLRHRIPGADFDEVTYADDAICITTDTKTLNLFVKHIEEGERYGMRLNKNKCEVITSRPNANIHFGDGTKINKVRQAIYLGCQIGIRTQSREEVNNRIKNTMITMKSLDLFWRHSNCGTAIKVYVADAVIRSKLLYGLESAELIPSVLKRLETIQLKVLRKILRMDTTYINRENTNEKVFGTANQNIEEEGRKKKVVPFIEAHRRFKLKRMSKTIKHKNSTLYNISFQGDRLKKWIHKGRRPGRPRSSWTEETIKEIWNHIRQDNPQDRFRTFDEEDDYIINKIHEEAANDNIMKPTATQRNTTNRNRPTEQTQTNRTFNNQTFNTTIETQYINEPNGYPQQNHDHRNRLCREENDTRRNTSRTTSRENADFGTSFNFQPPPHFTPTPTVPPPQPTPHPRYSEANTTSEHRRRLCMNSN